MKRYGVALMMVMGILVWSFPSIGAGGSEKWSYPLSVSSMGDFGGDIAVVDHYGNWVLGTTSFNSTSMEGAVGKFGPDGKTSWSRQFGGDFTYSMVSRVAVDNHDNIIVAGEGDNGAGVTGRVAAYSPEGNLLWKTDIDMGAMPMGGSPSFSMAFSSVHVDSKGNIYLTGPYFSSSGMEGRLIALSATGQVKWDKRFEGSGTGMGTGGMGPGMGMTAMAIELAVDNNGNVAVVGIKVNSAGDHDWYIDSYSPDGNRRWEATFDSGGEGIPYSVEIDGNNNIVVAGTVINKSGNEDWYVASYSPNGVENWHATYDSGKGDDEATGLAINSRNDVVVAGERATGSSYSEWYVVSYSSTGAENWSASGSGFGALGSGASSVAIDGNDNAIVAGGKMETSSTTNPYIVSYSPAGVENWHAQYSSSNQWFWDVAVDVNSGDVLALSLAPFYMTTSGYSASGFKGYAVSYEGTGSNSRRLGISDVRVMDPAPENPSLQDWTYLGFGSVVNGGNKFQVKAKLPRYVAQNSNSVHDVPVKVFIAAQLPDNYSVLHTFTETGDLVEVPPASLSPWKRNLTTPVEEVIYPAVDITTSGNGVPAGTHYWYTLVVPDYVPDDLSGVDWMNTPWELTLSVFDVK